MGAGGRRQAASGQVASAGSQVAGLQVSRFAGCRLQIAGCRLQVAGLQVRKLQGCRLQVRRRHYRCDRRLLFVLALEDREPSSGSAPHWLHRPSLRPTTRPPEPRRCARSARRGTGGSGYAGRVRGHTHTASRPRGPAARARHRRSRSCARIARQDAAACVRQVYRAARRRRPDLLE